MGYVEEKETKHYRKCDSNFIKTKKESSKSLMVSFDRIVGRF